MKRLNKPGGKVNAKGRNMDGQHIRLHRGVTGSAAWQSLSCEARCVVMLVWERHNGHNNGQIPLSRRETRTALRIGTNKVQRAFADAMDRGFLIERDKGSFNYKVRHATEWEITAEPCDDKPAKRSYRTWVEKQNPGIHDTNGSPQPIPWKRPTKNDRRTRPRA